MQWLTDSVPITRLRRLLIPTSAAPSRPTGILWLGASLMFAVMYAVPALRQAFSNVYVVQDDARQYLFWMRRFLEPGLFPHDVIAEYYRSTTPPGVVALYRFMTVVGIDPILLSKVLPMLLGVITAAYCFAVCMRLLPVPAAAFAASLLLSQNLWMRPDLVSSTPRAFLYPLFMGFLYYLLRRSLVPCLVTLGLQGLFYPQITFVSVGVLTLSLLRREGGVIRFSRERSDWVFFATGVGVALLVVLPYAARSSEFGPLISATEARSLPEFSPSGTKSFFRDNPWSFWLTSNRSGLLNMRLKPPLIWIGLTLPILLRYPSRFPLAMRVTGGVSALPRIILASLGMFFAAHALLFRLYTPNRYIIHSLPMVMALASGIALTVMLDSAFSWAEQRVKPRLRVRRALALGIAALLVVALIPLGGLSKITGGRTAKYVFKTGRFPSLYEFFSRQPEDTLIASLAREINNIPTFSKRSILVGSEYALPYHVGYYRQIRQRATDLIRAHYSQDLTDVQRLIRTYGVDFIVIERDAFTPEYLATNRLIRQFEPGATEALISLERGIPALGRVMERCLVLSVGRFIVLEAECIERIPRE